MKNASFADMPQSLKDGFLKVNPDPKKLRTMYDRDVQRMQRFADVSDSDLRSITASTLILMGDRDIVKPEHGLELSHLIPSSRLLILPGGHGDYLGESGTPEEKESRYPELVAGLIEEFLDGF